MTSSEHVEILRRGPRIWNAWRAENPSVVPDLAGISLSIGDRQMGPMNGGPINLSRALLTDATLYFATLTGADMRGAELANTDLRGARLEGVDLTGADLAGAQLDGASLAGACLKAANLCGASLADVRGLTAEQVEEAEGDLGTVLPFDVERPVVWTVGQGAYHHTPVASFDDEPEPAVQEYAGAGHRDTDFEASPEPEPEPYLEPEPEPEPQPEPEAVRSMSAPEGSNPLRRLFRRSAGDGAEQAAPAPRPVLKRPQAPKWSAPELPQRAAVDRAPPAQPTTTRAAANGNGNGSGTRDGHTGNDDDGEDKHITWLVGGPRRVGRRDRPGQNGNWRDRA